MLESYFLATLVSAVAVHAQLLCKGFWYQECAFIDIPNRDRYLYTCVNLRDIRAPGIEDGSFEKNISSYKIPADRMCLFYAHECSRMPPYHNSYLSQHVIIHKAWPGSSLTNISQRADATALNPAEALSERQNATLSNDQLDLAGKMVSVRCSRRFWKEKGKGGVIRNRNVTWGEPDWWGGAEVGLRSWDGDEWDEEDEECGKGDYFAKECPPK